MSPELSYYLRRNAEPSASNGAVANVGEDTAQDPLAELVAGCRKLEPSAQRELVLQTQEQVHGVLVRLVGQQDAEDVAQQVYLQVFRQLSRFRGDSSFRTWLFRITVNEARQHLRQNRRRRWSPFAWEPREPTPDQRKQVETRELLAWALAKIEPDLRIIFVLKEVEGLSYEAISATMDIPLGTVASRLSRARHELQKQLTELGWTGGQP